MPRVRNPMTVARGRAILLASAALIAGGVVVGCDTQEDADLERGRTLFQNNCGTCHTLAEAGTAATVGPDLDASFAAARAVDMDQDTIEGVVQQQIANPREISQDSPYYDRTFMPADIVTGQDAEDVSAYVASVAGIPGIEPPPLPGEPDALFAQLCGTCHTLAAAGTSGTTGPNLDESLPGQKAQQIETSIRDPDQVIAPGFEAGIMPPFSETQLPQEDLDRLVEFLLQNAGSASAASP
jgi:mono/diheme cytochrome c family protein